MIDSAANIAVVGTAVGTAVVGTVVRTTVANLRLLPATGDTLLVEPLLVEPLVLLHGWGCDSRSWSPLLTELNRFCYLWVVDLPGFGGNTAGESLASDAVDINNWLQQLLPVLPPRAAYLGWSLGGMVATHLALHYPQRVSRLITIAANLRFVASDHWPHAMTESTFTEFCQSFATAPELTLKRFAGLMAKGDSDERQLLKSLRLQTAESLAENNTGAWLRALHLLGELDHTASIAKLTQPCLHIFGEHDSLVPVAVAALIQAQAPTQNVVCLADAAHAPHVSQPAVVANAIRGFFSAAHYAIEKRKVAQSFSRAATTYDSVADLQRRVGNHLLTLLPRLNKDMTLLDVGAGTGYFTGPLSEQADVIGLDIAAGMIDYARLQHPQVPRWVCADAESLPLAAASIDCIFSSLSVQWCARVDLLCSELARVLKPSGRLCLATLGPETLHELRRAWQQVDHYAHVNRFTSVQVISAALEQAGFNDVIIQREQIVLEFAELKQLTHELKALGAHNMNSGQSAGLTGRSRVQAFKAAYEAQRNSDGLLPATYDVYYLTATR